MSRVLVKVADYPRMGVPFVWLIDLRKRMTTIYTATEALGVEDGILRTGNPELSVVLSDLF